MKKKRRDYANQRRVTTLRNCRIVGQRKAQQDGQASGCITQSSCVVVSSIRFGRFTVTTTAHIYKQMAGHGFRKSRKKEKIESMMRCNHATIRG